MGLAKKWGAFPMIELADFQNKESESYPGVAETPNSLGHALAPGFPGSFLQEQTKRDINLSEIILSLVLGSYSYLKFDNLTN